MSAINENWYTVEEIAEKTKLHKESIRRLIRSGKLSAVRFGKVLRISDSSFQEYINGHRKDSINDNNRTKELLNLAGKWIGPREEYEAILKTIEESQRDTEF
ncbi:TPA: DNA-binding protein [bacterium]|jgi:excisionase family DNA binding protein|nr:DNA-binding protein [bacterium]